MPLFQPHDCRYKLQLWYHFRNNILFFLAQRERGGKKPQHSPAGKITHHHHQHKANPQYFTPSPPRSSGREVELTAHTNFWQTPAQVDGFGKWIPKPRSSVSGWSQFQVRRCRKGSSLLGNHLGLYRFKLTPWILPRNLLTTSRADLKCCWHEAPRCAPAPVSKGRSTQPRMERVAIT